MEPAGVSKVNGVLLYTTKASPEFTIHFQAKPFLKNDDLPSKYGIIIDIPSVAYLKSKETPNTVYCAVFLQLTFRLDGVLGLFPLIPKI